MLDTGTETDKSQCYDACNDGTPIIYWCDVNWGKDHIKNLGKIKKFKLESEVDNLS